MKNSTSFVAGLATAGMVLSLAFGAGATAREEMIKAEFADIKIVMDGQQLTPKDANGKTVEPFIWNGTTYLPVRAVGAAVGKDVSWDGDTKTVYLGAKEQATVGTVGTVLMDKNGVKVTYKGIEKSTSFMGGYDIKLFIENSSSTPYTVQVRDLSVNGTMCDVIFSSEVAAGKNINDRILIPESALEKNNITSIQSAEFYFTVFNSNTWSDSFDSDIVTIK